MDLHVGNPVVRGALTLFPVFNGEAVHTRGYDLGASALEVAERAGAPVVGELVVTNRGRRPARRAPWPRRGGSCWRASRSTPSGRTRW